MTPDPKAPDAAVDTSAERLQALADRGEKVAQFLGVPAATIRWAREAVAVLRSLASQPAEPEARYSAICDVVLEEAAKIADEMTSKWGNPIGSNYEQGVNDQGIRIAGRIRTRILKAQPAEPEGFETTGEERAQWLRAGNVSNMARLARDFDRVLRENATLKAAERVTHDWWIAALKDGTKWRKEAADLASRALPQDGEYLCFTRGAFNRAVEEQQGLHARAEKAEAAAVIERGRAEEADRALDIIMEAVGARGNAAPLFKLLGNDDAKTKAVLDARAALSVGEK